MSSNRLNYTGGATNFTLFERPPLNSILGIFSLTIIRNEVRME